VASWKKTHSNLAASIGDGKTAPTTPTALPPSK
jgi:hypothetical protein